MPRRGHTEEQILRALRQAENGTRVSDICREHGISEATYYSRSPPVFRAGFASRTCRAFRPALSRSEGRGRKAATDSAPGGGKSGILLEAPS
jgi:putative transposase